MASTAELLFSLRVSPFGASGFAATASAVWDGLSPVCVTGLALIGVGAAALGGACWVLWRRYRSQQRMVAALRRAEERLFPARSAEEVLRILRETLPGAFSITGVNLFLLDAPSRTLRQVALGDQEPVVCPVEGPVAPSLIALALCFRNRTLLAVGDVKQGGLEMESAEAGADARRSVMYVPLFAGGELAGVMELAHSTRVRRFDGGERSMAQHLANQVAAAVTALEQQALRERLRQDEQMAAAGRLISELAAELGRPLQVLGRRVAAIAVDSLPRNAAGELRAIAAEAESASGFVERLLSFARSQPSGLELVDLAEFLNALAGRAGREHDLQDLDLRVETDKEPAPVLAIPGQLEQAVLNLLIEAWRASREIGNAPVSVRLVRKNRRAVVEVCHLARPGRYDGETGLAGFGPAVSAAIAKSFGGGLHRSSQAAGVVLWELELPLSSGAAEPAGDSPSEARGLTVLVVVRDGKAGAELVALLGSRGHRAIPLSSGEAAAELAERLRLDAIFCAADLADNAWTSLYERVRRKVPSFVVLTPDPSIQGFLAGGSVRALKIPVTEAQLDLVLRELAAPRIRAARNGS